MYDDQRYIYIYYTHIHVYCMMSNFDTKMPLEMCQPMRHGMNVYLSFFCTMYNMCVCVPDCVCAGAGTNKLCIHMPAFMYTLAH